MEQKAEPVRFLTFLRQDRISQVMLIGLCAWVVFHGPAVEAMRPKVEDTPAIQSGGVRWRDDGPWRPGMDRQEEEEARGAEQETPKTPLMPPKVIDPLGVIKEK